MVRLKPRPSWPVPLAFPPTRLSTDAEDFHGVTVPDPFRWLEGGSAPEVQDWIEAQNRLTSHALDQVVDRAGIHQQLRRLWSHTRTSLPVTAGHWTFQFFAEGLQDQPVLHASINGSRRALVDPNVMAPDGTQALTGWTPSPDGAHVAFALSRNGSDRQEIRIRNTQTGADLDEILLFSKSEEDLPYGNLAWSSDGAGFYYPRLPDPETVSPAEEYRNCRVFWHRLGTPQSADRLIHQRPDDPNLNFVPIVTEDGRFLVLHVWNGLSHRHQVSCRPIASEGAFRPLFPAADARRLFLGCRGDQFLFHTNADAPRGRIIALDPSQPAGSGWHEVIPQGPDTIDSAVWFGMGFIVTHIIGDHHEVTLYDASGNPGPLIALPGQGRVVETGYDKEAEQILMIYEDMLQPPAILRFDAKTGASMVQTLPAAPVDSRDFLIRHDHATAEDGTHIPITLIYRRDLPLIGRTPLLLYGYGGFNVNITPGYDASRLLWLQRGGIYAFVNLRGGGEFGEDWHHAGAGAGKQIVFDDFIEAARWVIAAGYTDNAHLAISGESNGGLLVSACMLQKPELFSAVVCSIPVTDLLRYPDFTIGSYWIPEYGDARADPEAFSTLRAYSPLHNVRPGMCCPALLLTTGQQDDRVVPAHAYKLAAMIQTHTARHSGPCLLRAQPNVGHGLGKPVSKMIELDSDIYSFLFATCGIEGRQQDVEPPGG